MRLLEKSDTRLASEIAQPPVAFAATDRDHKVPQDLATQRRVGHFWMELNPILLPLDMPHGRHRAGASRRQRAEQTADLFDLIPVKQKVAFGFFCLFYCVYCFLDTGPAPVRDGRKPPTLRRWGAGW